MIRTNEIKKVMIDRNISVNKLSEQAGVSRVWMSGIINGHKQGSDELRNQIAKILKVPVKRIWVN